MNHRWRKYIGWGIFSLVLLIVVGVIAKFAIRTSKQTRKTTENQSRPSETEEVQPSPDTSPTPDTLIGNVLPFRTSTVSSEVSGKITARRIRPGDSISPRQIPDGSPPGIHLNGDRSKGNTPDPSRKLKHLPPYPTKKILIQVETNRIKKQLRELAIRIEQRELELNKARRDKQDIQAAINKGGEGTVYSEQDLEDAEHRVQIAEKQLKLSRIQYERNLETLYDHYVTAPFAGRIKKVHVETGELIQPGQPLFTIMDLSRVKVEFFITESMVAKVKQGDKFEFTVDAYPERKQLLEATVYSINPTTDPNHHRYRVLLSLQNPEKTPLYPGMICRVQIKTR